MADASSGASGASGSQDSAASRAQESQAAAEAAEAQMAAAAAAVNAAPTPSVTSINPAPIDLSIPTGVLSQLNTMQVSTPTLDFSSLSTLGGIPSNPTYADIATATAPTTPTVQEINAFSPTFSIDGINTANPAATDISAVGVNLGVNYTGATVNASLAARMGLSPLSASVTGKFGYAADVSMPGQINAFDLSLTAGPFGTAAAPNYGATLNTSLGLTDVDSLSVGTSLNFDTVNGFKNGSATLGLTHDFSDTVQGYAKGNMGFDTDGITNVGGETGLGLRGEDGASLGLTGRGNYDVRTGDFTGYAGVRANFKF